MDLKKELEIITQQPIYGWKGSYLGELFKAIIDDWDKEGGAANHLRFVMSQTFSYGLIQGKRTERARRKGEQYDIDGPYRDPDKVALAKMVAMLQEMSVEEIQQVHTLALEHVQPGEKAITYLNDLVAKIIEGKEKEGAADD